jgi:hypothetical protein
VVRLVLLQISENETNQHVLDIYFWTGCGNLLPKRPRGRTVLPQRFGAARFSFWRFGLSSVSQMTFGSVCVWIFLAVELCYPSLTRTGVDNVMGPFFPRGLFSRMRNDLFSAGLQKPQLRQYVHVMECATRAVLRSWGTQGQERVKFVSRLCCMCTLLSICPLCYLPCGCVGSYPFHSNLRARALSLSSSHAYTFIYLLS